MAFGVLALVAGLGLVWLLGIACVLLLVPSRPDAARGELPIAVGTGWFVGAFLLTLLMRALSSVGVSFSVVSVGLPLLLACALLLWLTRSRIRHDASGMRPALLARDLPPWQRVLWLALLAWLAWRFALLLGEVVWRPLYPWDAWTQWGTKAKVWFELRRMVPFVFGPEWLQATTPDVYFDAAPHYPATVPLWQTWAALLLRRWDDSLVNLPWWISGVAFALAMYGFLAREGFPALFALIGTWLVMSLPILDVHIALAGYADLPMAAYLTLAALWSLRAIRTPSSGVVAIAALLLVACIFIKVPGKVWIVTLAPGLLAAAWPRKGPRIALIALGASVAAMLVLAQTEPVVFGYRLHLEFNMPWSALADAYFTFSNWHLLWYGCIAVAIVAWRFLLAPTVAPLTLFVAAGVLFLLFGFAFTNARIWVEDQTTVNRATLHLAPLAVVWMLTAFRAWTTREPVSDHATPSQHPVSEAASSGVAAA